MKALAVILVLFFVGIVSISTSVGVGAIEAPSWTGGLPTVMQNDYTVGPASYCDGVDQSLYIAELKSSYQVCFYGDEPLKIGYFSSGGPYRGAVGFPYSNELHLLEGVCAGIICRYSADQDMIVTQQPINQFGWGIVVFLHASERIKQVRSSAGTVRYVFDASNPDYVMKNDVGRYIWSPSYALSDNGKWLVVELRDAGLALIHTDSFESRQIITAGHVYGYGHDPNEQLAVSNDGKSVAITGVNAGLSVIDVTANCGQQLIGGLGRQPTTIECPSRGLDIGTFFPNFRFGELPHFFGDGYQLGVTITSWGDGRRRVTFLAHGATPAHKLKFLSLGDSFTSGEGETDKAYYQPGTDDKFDACHVSKRSYPLLVAAAIDIGFADARTVACAGARVGDIIGSSDAYHGQGGRLGESGLKLSVSDRTVAKEVALDTFQPGRMLQSAFIERYNPEMITIGVGGNDAGLMGKLGVCAMPGTCEWAQGDGLRSTAGEIKRLFDTLGALFYHISERYPASKVYVVGYPNIIEADGACSPLTGLLLDHTERVFIENGISYLNQVIHAATQKAGFTYLDVEQSMKGRNLCSGSTSMGVNGLRSGDDIAISSKLSMLKVIGAGTFHPTPTGHTLMADAILAGHPGLRQDTTCARDPMACSVPAVSLIPPAYWGISDGQQGRKSFATDFATPIVGTPNRFKVELPKGTFEPDSSVRAEIHSSAVELGTFLVSSLGEIGGTVDIPEDIEAGFHTLHLFGQNREGEAVDIYQFVSIGQEGEILGVVNDEHESPVPPVSGAVATISMPQSAGSVDVLGAQDVAVGESAHQFALTKPIQYAKQVLRDNKHLILIGIGGVVVVSLMVAAIIVVRRWAKPGS